MSEVRAKDRLADKVSKEGLDGNHLTPARIALKPSPVEGTEVVIDVSYVEVVTVGCAVFDASTSLKNAKFGDTEYGFPCVADTAWNGVSLSSIDWSPLVEGHTMLGDEWIARKNVQTKDKDQDIQLRDYQDAARAYRQLSVALQNQGLTEQASALMYRSQRLQHTVYELSHNQKAQFASWFLDTIVGYGYKPLKCLWIYLFVQGLFSAIFACILFTSSPTVPPQPEIWHALILSPAPIPRLPTIWNAVIQVPTSNPPSPGIPEKLVEAVILSVTSFHGRALLPGVVTTTVTIGIFAAIEGVIGLVIEAILVATLIQRFFR